MTDASTETDASREPPTFLLDVHLFEYQALTTRATYYIVMSTALWPLIFLYLTFLAVIWQHLRETDLAKYGVPLMVWGGGLGVQIALVIWTFLVREQHKTVLYVEKRLRPLVQELVRTPDFWLYEQKLHGRTPLARWLELGTELWLFVLFSAAIVLRVWLPPAFTRVDGIALALNFVVFIVLVSMAVSAAKIRHRWET